MSQQNDSLTRSSNTRYDPMTFPEGSGDLLLLSVQHLQYPTINSRVLEGTQRCRLRGPCRNDYFGVNDSVNCPTLLLSQGIEGEVSGHESPEPSSKSFIGLRVLEFIDLVAANRFAWWEQCAQTSLLKLTAGNVREDYSAATGDAESPLVWTFALPEKRHFGQQVHRVEHVLANLTVWILVPLKMRLAFLSDEKFHVLISEPAKLCRIP